MVNISGGKVEVVVLVDIKDLQKLQQAGIKFKQLKKDADAANASLKNSGDQAAASAVRFQTLTQGAINLTTAFVQTETTVSNLAKAKTSLKAAMVGVERAEDLLARKQVQLNQEMKKGIPDQEKIALLQREIATGLKDLEVKQDRVVDQTDQLNDTYKLFALNLLNVSFSAIQTGKAMIDSVPKIKELTKSVKLANSATSKYALVAIAAVAAWEILVGQLKIFGEEAAKTYSISGQINKIFGDMNVQLKDVSSEMEELTGAQQNYNRALGDTKSKLDSVNTAQTMQLEGLKNMLKYANDPNTIKTLARTMAMQKGASPQDFQQGSSQATNPPKEAGKNANVSETTTGTSITPDGQAVYDSNEATNEILSRGVGLGPGLGPHTFGFLTPLLMVAGLNNTSSGSPLISQELFVQKNYESFVKRQMELAKNTRTTHGLVGGTSGADILSFTQKAMKFSKHGLTPEQQKIQNIYDYLPAIIGQSAIQHGLPAPNPRNYSLVLQNGKLGTDFYMLSLEQQLDRFADYMAFGNPSLVEIEMAYKVAEEMGVFEPTPSKSFKPTAPEDLRTTLEKYPSGSTIGRHIIDPSTGISSYALVSAMASNSLSLAMSTFDFGTNTGGGLSRDPTRGSFYDRIMGVISTRNKLLQNTPENSPERYLPRVGHRTNIDFTKLVRNMSTYVSPDEKITAEQAYRILNSEVNVSSGKGLTQAQINDGATWQDYGVITGGAYRFQRRNNQALQMRASQITYEDRNRNRLKTGGRRVLNEDGTPMYDLWDDRAVEGGFTSISGYRDDWWKKFRSNARQAESFAQMLGNETKSAATYNTASSLIGSMNSTMGLLGRTGLSLSSLPSRGDFMPRRAGGGIGNVGNRYFSIMASISRAHQAAVSRTIAANQLTVKRAGQIDLLIGGFGLNSYYGSGLELQQLQLAVQKQDELIQSIGLNRTEAFRIIDTQGRGRNEIDDRVRWTQRNESISTGNIVL